MRISKRGLCDAFIVSLMVSLLAACGGAPVDQPGAEPAEAPPTQPSAFDGDPAAGKTIFQGAACVGCHTDFEDGTFSNISGGTLSVNNLIYPSKTDFTADTISDLATYIAAEMPPGDDGCDTQCAEDVAAYLWTYQGLVPVDTVANSCESTDPVFYGQRLLKLLTSYEYGNSLQSLFELPLPEDYASQDKAFLDTSVDFLPNHASEAVGDARLNQYDTNAQDLAAWAVANPASLPFSCQGGGANCINRFFDTFAFRAFRRPLTDAEKQEYAAIINSGPVGLQWAIHSVLSSPQFLYRAELGAPVGEVRSDGFPLAGLSDDYQLGSGSVTMAAADFPTKAQGSVSTQDGAYTIWSTSSISESFQFEGPTFLRLNARASNFDGEWPEMTVSVGGTVVAVERIDHADLREYEYLIYPPSGTQLVDIAFSDADKGRPPYDEGNDKSLSIGDVTIGRAVIDPVKGQTDQAQLPQAESDAFILDPYEYASALSYMYTASSPDVELLQAAAQGALDDPAVVEQHIDRLIDSPLGRVQVGRFARLWLRTGGVETVSRQGNAAFTDQVKASMSQEVEELFKHIFFDESVPFSDFYAGDFAMLDATLSAFYGIPGGGDAHMEFRKVPTTQRGGILTTGAFMAFYAHLEETSPIKRAVHVRQDLLCQDIPPPPLLGEGADRDANKAVVDEKLAIGTLTSAEKYDLLTNVGACKVCHENIINPLFGMDDFDRFGLPRKTVDGIAVQTGLGANGLPDQPIDYIANGVLFGAEDITLVDQEAASNGGLRFSGAKDLSKKLAELGSAQSCFVEKSFRYATGMPLGAKSVTIGDKPLSDTQSEHLACVSSDMNARFQASNESPRALFKSIGLSDVVRYRR